MHALITMEFRKYESKCRSNSAAIRIAKNIPDVVRLERSVIASPLVRPLVRSSEAHRALQRDTRLALDRLIDVQLRSLTSIMPTPGQSLGEFNDALLAARARFLTDWDCLRGAWGMHHRRAMESSARAIANKLHSFEC